MAWVTSPSSPIGTELVLGLQRTPTSHVLDGRESGLQPIRRRPAEAPRLHKWQSVIGNAGIKAVSTFINNKPQLVNEYTEIARYTPYAMKHGGPAFFKIPTPPEAIDVQDKKSPLYVAWPRAIADSCPKGALALITASLECSWNSYKTSSFESQGQFSKTTMAGAAIASYMVSIDKLSDAAWECILGACNKKTHQVIVVQSDDDNRCLDVRRKDFYEPSSP
ncbi:hypothetical protein C8J57DRAFT_1541347 [Mycena rebaudengoi]|nr:hypothetical protein C8J57DRAFT_1541347 [Mycena rebaudengoi]